MKYKRSLIRFALAAVMLVTGILMLDNLAAGIFVLFVAAYSLISGILWLRVDRRQNGEQKQSGGIRK
ncbi:hypothetical protein CDO73_05780 [Saccharibacillus sp. O23]|uniref:hypothetical protein n=1 Tax=Saccharibacillus sp. O23 TaxID=2009338 RepID=UPI000B4E12EE|nr:hypothetical protein [Saccharibacillus sp. O23]OWR31982.1 hypothetical protein CDO73_05780 [Saccharibacillus sp. O23]